MSVLFILLSIGLSSEIQPGQSCVDALHSLRTELGMDIVSTEAVGEKIVYTMAENESKHNIGFNFKNGAKKTVILGCQINAG